MIYILINDRDVETNETDTDRGWSNDSPRDLATKGAFTAELRWSTFEVEFLKIAETKKELPLDYESNLCTINKSRLQQRMDFPK